MKVPFLKQLLLVCVTFLAFSCDKEDENYTQQEATAVEESDSKTLLFKNNKVRVRVIDIETEEEVNFDIFKYLNIKARNKFTNEVFEPKLYRLFDLPNGNYEFYSSPEPLDENIVRIGDYRVDPKGFLVPDPRCADCTSQTLVLDYYYQTL